MNLDDEMTSALLRCAGGRLLSQGFMPCQGAVLCFGTKKASMYRKRLTIRRIPPDQIS